MGAGTSRVRAQCVAGLLSAGLSACGAEPSEGLAHDHDHDHDHEHGPLIPGLLDAGAAQAAYAGDFDWQLPPGFPRPRVPADNPMTAAKVELGRHIFYDKRLSLNQTFSCASCHEQARAFADQRPVGLGSTGELHSRGAMSLANVAYSPTLTWANPLLSSLERQAHVPIFGDDPVELGMTSPDEVVARFGAVARYHALFAAAFPGEPDAISTRNVERALSAFQRALLSGNSAFDRYITGRDPNALSESALRGMTFVTTNEDHRFECNHCHGGFNFSDHVTWDGLEQAGETPPFHQTGLYDLDGTGAYPAPNTGVHDISLDPADMGKFKAPTLRNIALTAPYMHDGSIATLAEVLDHYAKGGRARNTRRTDALIKPFTITEEEKRDVIAFLESLTDHDFIRDPRFSDPWAAPAASSPERNNERESNP